MYTLRSHIDNIFLEFLHTNETDICFIFLDWLPTNNPSKRDLLFSFLDKWYSGIAFRYWWTRESKWEFLEKSPSLDVKKILSYLQNSLLLDQYNKVNYDFSSKKFVLVWSSFGWAVLLDSMYSSIYKFILLSPVINIKEYNLEHEWNNLYDLQDFLRDWHWNAYNFTSENWIKMCDWTLFEPDYNIIKYRKSDILLIYSKDDKVVTTNSIEKFVEKIELQNVFALENYWHLSYQKVDSQIVYKIIDFVENYN